MSRRRCRQRKRLWKLYKRLTEKLEDAGVPLEKKERYPVELARLQQKLVV